MTTVSNVGGGDSLQLRGRIKNPHQAPSKGGHYVTTGQPPIPGNSYGEHSNDRRERLSRITGAAPSAAQPGC